MDDGSVPGKPLSQVVIKRLAIFCLITALIAIYFWAIGAYQDFLDLTESMLLEFLRFSSLGLILSSAAGIFAELFHSLRRSAKPGILGLLGYASLSALGGIGLFFAKLILDLGQGL